MSSYTSLAPYYDLLTRDVPYGAFLAQYEQIFRRYGVAPALVLDLACGTGTLTCLMAEHGYEMIGTDASEDMLAEAAAKAGALTQEPRPLFIRQAMDELDLYGTVGAAVCSLDGINYARPDALDEIFRRLRLFIEPTGVLIFDILPPARLRERDGQVFVDETEDVYCVWRAEYDGEEDACRYGMDIFAEQNGLWSRSFEEHIEYAHAPETLIRKLTAAGFGEITLYGAFTPDPPAGDEERIFIAARRL